MVLTSSPCNVTAIPSSTTTTIPFGLPTLRVPVVKIAISPSFQTESLSSVRTSYPVWSSGVKSTPGSYVFLLNWNGKLGVFGPKLWSNTDETVLSESAPWNTTADYFLFSHQVTPVSYGILVTFKNFRLVLTQECNLVLENMNTGNILWQTSTSSPYRDCFTYLDERGELFIKHNRRDILWRSGNRADEPAQYPKTQVLALRYDGRLVIYHPQIWSLVLESHPLVLESRRAVPWQTDVGQCIISDML